MSGRTKFISNSFDRSILFIKSTRRNFDGESPRAKMRTHFLEGGICRHLPTLQLARPIYKTRPRGIARSPLPPTYHGRPACKSTPCMRLALFFLIFERITKTGQSYFRAKRPSKPRKAAGDDTLLRQTVSRHA